jgi:ribose transport system substrate-binding protein
MRAVVLTPEQYKNMSRREFLKLMSLVAGGATLAACGGAAPTEAPIVPAGMIDTSKYAKKGPWKIGFSSQGPTNSWVLLFEAHVEYGVTELYKNMFSDYIYTDSNANAEKQVNDMQDILVQEPDLILLAPVGAAALVGATEQAMSQNIPVILLSSKVETDNYVSFIEPNNITMGQEQAKYIVDKLNGQGNVIMLSGIAGASAAEDRLAGARGVFAQSPGIKEIGQAYCDWSPVKGKQATEGFLAANPKIDGIWSDSGVMAIGAIQAFQAANRKVPPVTGENFNGYLRVLVENNLDGFAILYPPSIGLTGVELAIATLRGQAVPYYISVPMPTYQDSTIADLYVSNMPDDYWPGSQLPPEWINKLLGTG